MKNIEFVKGPCVGEVRRVADSKASRIVASGFAAFRSKKVPVTGAPRPIVGRGKAPKPLIHQSNPARGQSARGSKAKEK